MAQINAFSGKDFTCRYNDVCSQYLAVNTQASRPGPAIPRSMGRDGAGASAMQSFFTQTVRIDNTGITHVDLKWNLSVTC